MNLPNYLHKKLPGTSTKLFKMAEKENRYFENITYNEMQRNKLMELLGYYFAEEYDIVSIMGDNVIFQKDGKKIEVGWFQVAVSILPQKIINKHAKFGGALYVIPHFMNKMMLGDHPIDWLYRYWKSAYSKECIKYEELIHQIL